MASGTYTGNGLDNRLISGVGFAPDYVIIKGNLAEPAVCRTSTMSGDASKMMVDYETVLPNMIQSLEADGFSLGTSARVNSSGVTYHWVAFSEEPGEIDVGSYLGVGFDSPITGLGFQPDYVMVIPEGAALVWQSFSSMPAGFSLAFNNLNAYTELIQEFVPDGFVVGTGWEANNPGWAYHYVAWKATEDGLAVGTYVGDSSDDRNIAGPAFEPEYVMIQTSSSSYGAHRSSAQGPGDISMQFGFLADSPNEIQSLYAGGFQVGSDVRVNGVGNNYYWAAFANPPPHADLVVSVKPDWVSANPGNVVDVPISLTNTGPDDATTVQVLVPIPAGLTLVSASTDHGTFGSGNWYVGTVASGTTAKLALRLAVDPGPGGFDIPLGVTIIGADQDDPDASNNQTSATIHVNETRANALVLSGTYIGDGSDDRIIDGVGFQPDLVILKGNTDEFAYARSATMDKDLARALGKNDIPVPNVLQNFHVDGFEVGSDPAANAAGVIYHWIAFSAAPGQMQLGTYVGDETDDRSISGVGFQPNYVLLLSEGDHESWHRSSAMVGDLSAPLKNDTVKSDRIQSLTADGFQIGTNKAVNEVGFGYHYVAWKALQGSMMVGSYLGDGFDDRKIPDLGLDSEYVIIKSEENKWAAHRTAAMGEQDATLDFDSKTNYADGIQAMDADQIVVGADDRVNKSNKTYYWMAFSSPLEIDLAVTKTVGEPTANEGNFASFQVTVTNNGPGTATGIRIDDALPVGLTHVFEFTTHGSYDPGTGMWTIGTLAFKETATLNLTARIDPGTGGQVLTNTASVDAVDQYDNQFSNNTASADVTVNVGTPRMRIATGTFTGDGQLSQAITGADFRPDAVIIKSNTTQNAVCRTATMTAGLAKLVGADSPMTAGLVLSLDNDGFTVGNSPTVNQSAVEYHWVAFQAAAGELAIGSYVGDGLDNRQVTGLGLDPAYMTVFSELTIRPWQRFADMPVDQSIPFAGNGAQPDKIQQFVADGFEIGTASEVNQATVRYHYLAWADTGDRFQTGTYSGNSINRTVGTAFEPEYVLVKIDDTSNGLHRTGSLGSDPTSLQFAPLVGPSTGLTGFQYNGFDLGNHALANTTGSDYYYAAFSDIPQANADLKITVVADTPTANPGQQVTISLAVMNNGPIDATGVQVTDLLPAGLSFDESNVMIGNYNELTGVWTVGSLPTGVGAMIQIRATVTSQVPGTLITNYAAVTGSNQIDPVADNDSGSVQIRVLGADLSVSKVVDEPNPDPGDTVTYTVSITNLGPDPATGVALCDTLPAGLKFIDAVASRGSYSSANATWTAGGINPSNSVILTIRARVEPTEDGGTITNTARICATDLFDPEAGNNTDSVDLHLRPAVNLQMAMSASDTLANLGDVVTFRIDLENTSGHDATGIQVATSRSAGMSWVIAQAPRGTFDPGSGLWVPDTVYAGESIYLELGYRIQAGDPGDTLSVLAEVTQVDQRVSTGLVAASAWTKIASSDLAVTKTVDQDQPYEDETVVFTVVLENIGPDPATGIAVTDDWPAELVFESASTSAGTFDDVGMVWSLDTLAAGAMDTLTITATIGAAANTVTNTALITAQDQIDPDVSDNSDSVELNVVETSVMGLTALTFSQETRPLYPGQTSEYILRFGLGNHGFRTETLDSLTLTNVATGFGTQAQLDANWSSLSLVIYRRTAVDLPELDIISTGSGTFENGRLTFADLDVAIAPGDSITVSVRGGVSLQAHDGDVLRVAIAGPGDLVFSNPVDMNTSWPLQSNGSLVVNGMTAAQIQIHHVLPAVFQVGSGRNPALSFTLPPNGYESDTLTKLNVANYGDAEPGEAITRMEAWIDNGDGSFDPASDTLLGELYSTGGRYERTDLNEPVGSEGLRIFVTVDINELALNGSVRLGLPGPDDFGVGMASGNDGPVDLDLINPFTQTISASDRLIMSTGQLDSDDVVPGGTVPVLHLIAHNIYDVPKTLQRITVRNASTGALGESGAAMDGLVNQLLLRRDGNGDGMLGTLAEDPVLGTSVFDGGSAVFSGLTWEVPADSTLSLFLTGEVSLTGAADGDTLAALIAGSADLDFTESVALVASWPLDSGSRRHVDGMVAAQVGNRPVPPVTLAPGEGPILAFDITVPSNGTYADTVQVIEVINAVSGPLAATDADFTALELWQDAGLAGFDPAEDVNLGTMTPIAGRWRLQDLDLPIPADGSRLFVSVRVSLTPTNSATLMLALPVNGLTMASANDGPHDEVVECPSTLMLSTAPLISDLEWEAAESVEDMFVTLRMVVRNKGGETINGISPSSLTFSGTGAFYPPGSHSPASMDLSPSQVDTFVWNLQAQTLGDVQVSGFCSGTGAVGGQTRSSLPGLSPLHHVYLPATEVGLFPVVNMPFSINRGQEGVVPLTLTLLNPGGDEVANAELRRLTIALDDGNGIGIVPSDLLGLMVVSEGLNIYLNDADLETSGSTILLDLTESVTITGQEPVTLALRMNILSNTTVESFRVSIADSTWLEAYDQISGLRVPVMLEAGTFPVQSSPGTLVGEAVGLDVNQVVTGPVTSGQGQTAVHLLDVELVSEGTDFQSSDVEIGSFSVSLVDTLGNLLVNPQNYLQQISVLGPLQIHAAHTISSSADATVTFQLSPSLTVPVGSQPLSLTLLGDIRADADLGSLRLRLDSPSSFDARDGNTGASVQVDYVPDPIEGATVTIQGLATDLKFSGQAALPAVVPLGATGVTALSCTFRHPGVIGTAAIAADTLLVRIRDELRQPLPSAQYVDRIHVMSGGLSIGEGVPSSQDMGEIRIPLSGFLLAVGESIDLDLDVNFEAGAPVGSVELMITSEVLDARDANLGSPVAITGEAGDDLPLSSGLTTLQAPPELLTAGFTDMMPAVLAPGGQESVVAYVRVTNPSAPGYATVGIAGITLHAADGAGQMVLMGDAVSSLRIFHDGNPWASVSGLTSGDTTATLTGASPLALPAGQMKELELRIELLAGTSVTSLMIGLADQDIAVAGESGGSVELQVLPEPGEAFPFWTKAGNVSALDLEDSYSNFPNPFAAGREATNFTFALESEATVSLRLYTARGEIVLDLLSDESFPAGLHQDVLWDGLNGRGTTVRNGVYVAEIRVRYNDGTEESYRRKVAVVR